MSAMFFLAISATDIFVSSLPEMVRDFNSTPNHVNLIVSMHYISFAFMSIFSGEFSNRFGRRPILLAGLAIFSIASALIPLVPSINMVIFLRVIQAIGSSFIIIIPRLLLKDCMDEQEQISANGTLLIALIISPAIAPVIGAQLATLWGWKSCFVFSAVLGFVLLDVAIKILPETNFNKITQFAPCRHYWQIYSSLLKNRLFWTLSIFYAAGLGSYSAFIGISSYLYINSWHVSPQTYSLTYIFISAAYLIGNRFMKFLNKKNIKPTTIIGIGIYITAAGSLIVALSIFFSNTVLLIAIVTCGTIFMRTANAISNPPVQVRIINKFPEYSAQSLGITMCLGLLTSGLSVSMVTIFHNTPLIGLIIVSGFFALISLTAFYFNRKRLE